MTERQRPSLFIPSEIIATKDALPVDNLGRRPIDTTAAYRAMVSFCATLNDVMDPVGKDEAYSDRFISFLASYVELNSGERVVKNNFWLESVKGLPQKLIADDTTAIIGRFESQAVILTHDTTSTNLVLLEEPILSGERYIGHAYDEVAEKEKALRPGFWDMDTLEKELDATHKLAKFGYPVPQNAQPHQLFLPWIDTIIYDWIPGKDLRRALTDSMQEGNLDQASTIAKLFGQHLQQVWKPLLDGRLPDGSVYNFPDNALGNFIYKGNLSPREAFSRIDIGKLHGKSSQPIGSEKYLEEISREFTETLDMTIRGQSERLIRQIKQGFSEA